MTTIAIATASPAYAKGVNGHWELTPTTPGFAGESWDITSYCRPSCTSIIVGTTYGPFEAFLSSDGTQFDSDRVTKTVIAYCKDGTSEGGAAEYHWKMDKTNGTGTGTLTLFPSAACLGVPRTSPDLPLDTTTMNFRLTQTAEYDNSTCITFAQCGD